MTASRLLPLDSVGQTVVWCYHGQLPDTRLVVVEKSRQRIMVLRYLGKLALEYEYPCASGQQPGPKGTSRDEKTPEGVYFVTRRYKDRKITIFGDRALHLNYPNPEDQAQGRDGDGIYIHGSNRTYKPRSSNGCLVLANQDLAQVEPQLNEQFTPVIVVERMALPSPALQDAACEYLRTVDIVALSNSTTNLPNSLELLQHSPFKVDLSTLAADLERLGAKAKAHNRGLALFGAGGQWVLLVNQEIEGPGRRKVEACRRFYLSGDKPGALKMVQSQWVLPNLAEARLLASWAPPKPVAVASISPTPVVMASDKTRPSPRPKASAPPALDQTEQVKAMLTAWTTAWQHKQLEQYMSFYARDFHGSGKNWRQWRKHKEHLNRVYKKITVRMEDVRIKVSGTRAQVGFIQRYSSDWHHDLGVKHLELVRKNGRWLIRAESWQELPASGRGQRRAS